MKGFFYRKTMTCMVMLVLGNGLKAQTVASADKPTAYIITVQPIVVCADDGSDPASMALPEDMVDKAYSKADIDFYFVEPIYYHNTKARDGLINLDEILVQAKRDNILRGYGNIVNMFFVNAVDGKKGPLGRGAFGGSVTFIALDKNSKKEHLKDMETFVIAHEVGHNLGLAHAVDDENVPKDVPNIMGEGEFGKRIDPEFSLTPYQIGIIYKSELVKPRINFLKEEEARNAILDETFEPYFSQLQKKEVAAFTSQKIPYNNIDEIRTFARDKFVSALISFSPKEQEALSFVVGEIDQLLLKNEINLPARHPWNFIKVQPWLCGGFAHTRGNTIVLSEKYLKFIEEHYKADMNPEERFTLLSKIGPVLLHEQMHTLERTHPLLFEKLYTSGWNFKKADVKAFPEITLNQVSNPDAPIANWLIPITGEQNFYYWPRTLLKENKEIPEMGKDFKDVLFKVQLKDGQYTVQTDNKGRPLSIALDDYSSYTNSFPVKHGLDHPNEITAYMMAETFKSLLAKQTPFDHSDKEARLYSEKFIEWYKKEMK